MVKRGPGWAEDLWSIPGGHLEAGETLSDAVRREVLEETGLEVAVGELVGILEITSGPHLVILDYLAEPVDERPPAAGSDASEVRWVPFAEIPTLECTPLFVETLRGWGVLP